MLNFIPANRTAECYLQKNAPPQRFGEQNEALRAVLRIYWNWLKFVKTSKTI